MNKEEAKAEIFRLSHEIDQHNYHYYVESNPQISDYDFAKDCFELVRIKNDTPTTIPMNEMSRSIWKKYSKDKNGKLSKGVDLEPQYLENNYEIY